MRRPVIFIINKIRYDLIRYHEMVDGTKVDLHFVGTPKYAKGFPEDLRKQCKTFLVVDELTVELFELLFRQVDQVDHLICFSEEDMHLAAVLRERFQITGTKTDTIRRFRDKVHMKESLKGARHLRIPHFLGLNVFEKHDRLDFEALVHEFGLPFVLKPRLGMACSGVYIIRSESDLENAQAQESFSTLFYEVEEFVQGSMVHIDSFSIQQEVQVAFITEYSTPPINYAHQPLIGVMQTQEQEHLQSKLLQANQEVIQTLALPTGCSHIELFITDENEIVFCEIGARFGGGSIVSMIETVSGYNLSQLWFNHELNEEYVPQQSRSACAAWIDIPSVEQTQIISVKPTMSHFEFVTYEECRVKPEQFIGKLDSMQNRMASYVVTGETPQDLQQNIQKLLEFNPIEWKQLR